MSRKAGIPLSVEFVVAETDSFRRAVGKPHLSRLLEKIRTYVYPQLKTNPFYGKNIKKLKGDFSDVYRYRIGAYRLLYLIEKEKIIVVVFDLMNRKDAY